MNGVCIAPAADSTARCSLLTVTGSKFCAEHSKLYRADYLRYKRIERSIADVFDGVETNDIGLLFRHYHRLSQAYNLRSEFRTRAIHPSLHDHGHKHRLAVIDDLLEETYAKIAAYYTHKPEESTAEVPDDDDSTPIPSMAEITQHIKSCRKFREKYTSEHFTKILDDFTKSTEESLAKLVRDRLAGLTVYGGETFALFLYGQMYHRVFRAMKRQIFDVGMHVLASPWLELILPDGAEYSANLMALISERETAIGDCDDVDEFYQGLDPGIIGYLGQLYQDSQASGRSLMCRMYRSGIHSYSLTFISASQPRIIRFRHKRRVIGHGERQYDHDWAYLVDLIEPKDELEVPTFRTFKNSLSRTVVLGFVAGSESKVFPQDFSLYELFTPQHFLDSGSIA